MIAIVAMSSLNWVSDRFIWRGWIEGGGARSALVNTTPFSLLAPDPHDPFGVKGKLALHIKPAC